MTETEPWGVPSIHDAAARRLVMLRDGRTGTLIHVPGGRHRAGSSPGTRARVRLPTGAWLSCDVDDLAVVPEERAEP